MAGALASLALTTTTSPSLCSASPSRWTCPSIVYGKFIDSVGFGKFEPRNYACYVNSYHYSTGNYVHYLTNHNDLGDYIIYFYYGQ